MAEDRNSLLQFLTRNYSTDELKTLCFQLFVDFDNLAGDTKSAKARELILHLERADRMSDLGPILGRDKPIAYRREFTKDPPIPRIPPRRNRDMNQVFLSHAQEDEAFARRIAADLLLGIIANPGHGPEHRLLEAELIIGQSTGPAPRPHAPEKA